jgi:hypothetical protein
MGGEPLDQDAYGLYNLLKWCSYTGKELWMFTKKPLEEIDFYTQLWCSHIKSGKYDCKLEGYDTKYGFKLASMNQQILVQGVDYLVH